VPRKKKKHKSKESKKKRRKEHKGGSKKLRPPSYFPPAFPYGMPPPMMDYMSAAMKAPFDPSKQGRSKDFT